MTAAHRFLYASLAVVILLVGGCQTVHPKTSAPKQQAVVDPDAARLQDIGGAILTYYALNKRMPPTLQDAAALADIDTELELISPVSGKPYVYNPQGLAIPGTDKRIVAYDPTPAPDGNRNCLIMTPPQRGHAVTCDVQAFPETVFSTLKPAH